jgi:hypothetical protein
MEMALLIEKEEGRSGFCLSGYEPSARSPTLRWLVQGTPALLPVVVPAESVGIGFPQAAVERTGCPLTLTPCE